MFKKENEIKGMMTKNISLKISEFKIIEEKAGTGQGKFEAYVAIFNNIDSYGDIILPGAFAKSLQTKLPKLCWSHNWDEIIGTVETAIEDERGLKITGQLVLSVQKAQEAFDLLKAGAVDEFSIGYSTIEASYETRNGETVRLLKELRCYEVSPVLAGANDETELIGVKSGEQLEVKEIIDMAGDNVKIVLLDGKEIMLKRNEVLNNYLTSHREDLKVKVDNNNKQEQKSKLIIIKKKAKDNINSLNWILSQLKDLTK